MSQQLTALPEKTQQQALRRVSDTASASWQSGQLPSPILQLQRLLGNQRVARQVMTMPIPDTGSNSMKRAAAPEDTPDEDKDKVLQTRPLTASITPLAQRQW